MFGSKQAKSGVSPTRIAWIVGGKYRFWWLNAGFWCIYGETCYNRGRIAPSAAVFDKIQCFGSRVEQRYHLRLSEQQVRQSAPPED
ncbi:MULTISPECIES: hypothetical protein [Eikenella]|uniref:Uncharacterized protein n=2 Tax=Eikenella TaxID=538 RepID=A0AAX1F5R3_9NEIS|nr:MULTISPECIES: hypothetical protein [Eikenella]QED91360.1 hypothetical protein EZJ17_00990 [Eikenella exigua]